MQSPARGPQNIEPMNSMGWDEDDLVDEDINAAIIESLLGPSGGRNNAGDGGIQGG